jgi:hypothetical protein
MAGAARSGRATSAGSALGIGARSEFNPNLGGTSAHQLFHPFLAAMRALDFRVAAEDQLLKILVASLTMELKNRHVKLLMNLCVGEGVRAIGP